MMIINNFEVKEQSVKESKKKPDFLNVILFYRKDNEYKVIMNFDKDNELVFPFAISSSLKNDDIVIENKIQYEFGFIKDIKRFGYFIENEKTLHNYFIAELNEDEYKQALTKENYISLTLSNNNFPFHIINNFNYKNLGYLVLDKFIRELVLK